MERTFRIFSKKNSYRPSNSKHQNNKGRNLLGCGPCAYFIKNQKIWPIFSRFGGLTGMPLTLALHGSEAAKVMNVE